MELGASVLVNELDTHLRQHIAALDALEVHFDEMEAALDILEVASRAHSQPHVADQAFAEMEIHSVGNLEHRAIPMRIPDGTEIDLFFNRICKFYFVTRRIFYEYDVIPHFQHLEGVFLAFWGSPTRN